MKLMDIEVARSIPRGRCFNAWPDPKSPGSLWFGAEKVIINPAVDGLFFLSAQHEGRNWRRFVRFLGMDQPRLVEHTWVSEATRGLESWRA